MAITHATSAPGTPPPAGLTVGGNEWNAAHVGGVDISALAGDLLPSADDTYDIGSASKRWSEGWIGGAHLYLDAGEPRLYLIAPTNGNAEIRASGIAVQLTIAAADGDSSSDGGEMDIVSGAAVDGSSGNFAIRTGQASGYGDSGDLSIQTGVAQSIADPENGGSSGEISIRPGGSGFADYKGGQLILQGGNGLWGSGGNVIIGAGASTHNTSGYVAISSADGAQGFEIRATTTLLGQLAAANLPTSDPGSNGVWVNAANHNALTIGSGA